MTLPRAALDPEALLAHAPYVRSLASELVFDAHMARDVEQEVLLAALRNSPPQSGALRPWLAVLVRNFARKAWRSGARREQREHGSAKSEASVTTPAEILEREELRRTLVERVLALEEPLRDALILRFFDELPPREIARRLELPVETVRSRIKRGLEILREGFDREHRGDRNAWALAFVHGLNVPASSAQIAGAMVSSIFGAVLMTTSKKVALTVVVIMLVALGILLREPAGPEDRPVSVSGEVAVLTLAKTTERSEPSREEAGSSDATRTALETAAPTAAEQAPTEGSLLLRVSWHDGTPAAGIGAFIQTGRSMFEGTREVRTDEAGACRIDHLKPRHVVVRLDRQGFGGAEVKAGELVELSMTIPDGNDLQGVVVEADGSPVAGAEIYVDHGFVMGHIVARSGADGRFSVRSISRQMVWLSARAPFHAPTHQVMVGGVDQDQDPRTEDVRLVFLARGGGLEGVLRDGEGRRVSNAQVLVGREVDWSHKGDTDQVPLPDGRYAYLPSAQRRTIDGEGRFHIAGVATGRQPVRVRAPGFGQWKGEAEIREGELARMEIALLPGTSVEGTLRDLAGRPVAGLPIVLAGEHAFHHQSGVAAADGSFALHDLPLGEFELVVYRNGEPTSVKSRLVGSPGAVLHWDPWLGSGLWIRGRILARGLDPTAFMILCTGGINAKGGTRTDTARPDAGGWFEFPDREDVPHRLVISSSLQPGIPLALLEQVTPSNRDVVVEIDPTLWPSARFKGRVLDAMGQALSEARVSLVREGGQNTTDLLTMDPTGAFDIGPYPPGRWRVQVWNMEMEKSLFVSDVVEVSAGQTFDFGELIVE